MKTLSGLAGLVLGGACVGYLGWPSSGGGMGGAGGAAGALAGAGGMAGTAGHTESAGGTSAGGGNGGATAGAGGTGPTGSGGTSAMGSGGVSAGSGGTAGHAVASGGTSGGGAGAGGGSATAGSGGAATGGVGNGGSGFAGEGGAGAAGHALGGNGGAGQAGAAGTDGGAAGAPFAPDILILLDRSGSMNDLIDGTHCGDSTCAAGSKWNLVKTALEGALPSYENDIKWGLKLFASSDTTSCLVSSAAELAPALSNATAIAALLDRVVAGTSTPTTAAEMAAARYLQSFDDPAPRFIVLITDGIPTCGTAPCAPDATGQTINQCDDANAIVAVEAAHDQGIPTMVVGIGTDLGAGASTLSQMAANGGFPRNASPEYYPVASASDLMAALTQIAATVTP